MCSKLRGLVSLITVEPCLLFFSLCQGLYVIVANDLYIQKVCQVNLNYSQEICLNITNNKAEQLEVQKFTSVLQGYNGILQALPSIVYALFAGPWSDLHGRKWLIVFACFGYIFNNGVFIINTIWFYELKAEYLLFECLQDFTGGYVVFFLACYSYIADVTTRESRTKRMAFLDGLFPAGFFTGMAMSGFIKDQIGYLGNFSLGIGSALIAMFYAAIFLKDSRKLRPKEVQDQIDMLANMVEKKDQTSTNTAREKRGKFAFTSLFDVRNVKSGFQAVFKRREHHLRSFLLLLGICFILEIFLINGKGPTQYLYFRRKFGWDIKQFGLYIGLYGFVGMFAQYVAVPFLSGTMKLHDTTIGLIALLTCAIQQVMVCFVPAGKEFEWIIYLAGLISFLSVTITTTCRSMVTKCVGPLEVGKVLGVMGAFQAAVPLASSPVYAYLYKATVETFPGAFLLFSAGLYLVVIALLLTVNIGMKRCGVPEGQPDTTFTPETMEKLLEMRKMTQDGTTTTPKTVLEMAPEGERFQEEKRPAVA